VGPSRYDSRWVGRMPIGLRATRYLMLRPFLVFAAYFLLVAALALAPASRDISAFYLIASPWLMLFMLFLHLPVAGAAIKKFRLPHEVRMNHALEHGTIFFLRRRYGRKFKIGGKAEPDGFRLNGIPSPDLVAPSFAELQEHLAKGNTRPVVSPHCGSMIVTAQALSAILLTLIAVSFMSLRLERQMKLSMLVVVLCAYLLLRRGLGYVFQKRLFLSVDFSAAEIRSIKQVKPQGPLERQQVYFVKTAVH
jgi:hypothetical protein